MVKMGFCHESVCKQEVFASKKHVPIGGKRHHTNQILWQTLYGKPCDLVAGEWKVVGEMAAED